jgi:hypothetical protein
MLFLEKVSTNTKRGFAETALDTGGARLVPPRLTCVQHSRRVRDPSTADRGGKWSRGSEKVRARRKKTKNGERRRVRYRMTGAVHRAGTDGNSVSSVSYVPHIFNLNDQTKNRPG